VTCVCGKTYKIGPQLVGKRLSCRACGGYIAISPEGVTAAVPADEYTLATRDTAYSVEKAAPPVVRGRKRARPSERAPVERSPSRWLPALAVGAAAVALLGIVCLWAGAKTAGIVLVAALSALVPLSRFFILDHIILDHIYRARIREQLGVLRCTVTWISWRPFQGLLFDKGWKLRPEFRFYDVTYTERDGAKKTELCAISFGIGPLWGDEID
jgi:hypothetical protein